MDSYDSIWPISPPMVPYGPPSPNIGPLCFPMVFYGPHMAQNAYFPYYPLRTQCSPFLFLQWANYAHKILVSTFGLLWHPMSILWPTMTQMLHLWPLWPLWLFCLPPIVPYNTSIAILGALWVSYKPIATKMDSWDPLQPPYCPFDPKWPPMALFESQKYIIFRIADSLIQNISR